jgi:glycosyltransferase involved in cell wall biosynthesis
MRVVIVSSYPPRPCGIGSYAAAQAERLRGAGHHVTVISPPDGDGDVKVDFFGGRPFRAAARLGGDAGRIMVHFQPALYFRPRAPLSKLGAAVGLLWLCIRRRQTEILVHEADRPRWWRPDEVILTVAFKTAPVLLFHTEAERKRLEDEAGIRVRSRLVSHSDGVRVYARPGRDEARARLGLPTDEAVFVSPGFLHPDKGLERAIECIRVTAAGRLYVVGSVKDRTAPNVAYAERLRSLASEVQGVETVERYVDDEELDMWIAAADAVVLPYRLSWSSGALARAQAIGTPGVVTDVGGLGEQASPSDVVVHDDAEMAAALVRISAARLGARTGP